MDDITHDDLEYARNTLLMRARRVFPGRRSLDAYTPTVESGLVVVQFEVAGAMDFAREVMEANADRVLHARKQYALDLFAACYASGMSVGSMVEQL